MLRAKHSRQLLSAHAHLFSLHPLHNRLHYGARGDSQTLFLRAFTPRTQAAEAAETGNEHNESRIDYDTSGGDRSCREQRAYSHTPHPPPTHPLSYYAPTSRRGVRYVRARGALLGGRRIRGNVTTLTPPSRSERFALVASTPTPSLYQF
ncbi:hypothetical protein C8F04DRAFT_482723 [Mycena alexandri]|uniref:Uncharacterized protein n=1 Tax=Mycena alexandri TaxID=1745969 RepID=A0AAD6RX41_9AGAR|nr:hypothetical protein C8F04DRAFT_482723 [Mycena alexandri]